MLRVSWFSVQLLCLLLDCLWWNRYVSADCWYNAVRYREGQEVNTAEPCLNCTCSKATLVCYLRVCPKLPNPPPPGCILLYRYKSCCPELICQDAPVASYHIEARSEVDDFDLVDRKFVDNACIINGTIYAPGSAMDSSTSCEYCYCLGGKQRCVKPKCLLPVEGCTPVYDSNSCCPVHYQCTESYLKISITTISPELLQVPESCLVAGKLYPKGHKILGVGHSVCDNCYCIRGLVRCEPLSCAPPLLGCLPVIKPGECCAASYNCSGTIETRPEPNYGNFPIVSKEYAKFRKEVSSNAKKNLPYTITNAIPTTKAHRISGYYGTTRHFAGNGLERISMKPKFGTTTIYPEKDDTMEKRTIASRGDATTVTLVDSMTDDSTTETTDNQSDPTENEVTMLASTIFDFFTQEFFKDEEGSTVDSTTTDASTTMETITSHNLDLVTLKTVTNTTDCIEGEEDNPPVTFQGVSNKTDERNTYKNGNLSVDDDVTVVDLESKVKISTATVRPLEKLPPSILSFDKDKEDYDYDIKPTLPPSLPNLKIIPFLPSDALDAKKKPEEKSRYPLLDERVTEPNIYTFTNLFSPPIETEGGFVPKEPPLLDNFYDIYHTTGIESSAVTPITASPIVKPNEAKEKSCLSEGLEIRHGEAVTSKNVCVVCVCYYGDIVCQDPRCLPLKKGCQETGILDRATCCPRIICDDEDPQNLILDQVDITSDTKEVITVADGIISPNPFKDVIRTEPAPNLQTLIEDLPDFIRRNPQTTVNSSTIQEATSKNPAKSNELSLDTVLHLLLNDNEPEKTTAVPTATAESNPDVSIKENTKPDEIIVQTTSRTSENLGVGQLKLAGCNIYGRMYRVGRIISELSGPCLECKCTEIGVQCKKLC